MPVAKPESSDARVIAHVDMDCFYVQVEQRKQPNLRGLPTAVVQYNEWKGGGLIAVSYEARNYGVKRSMRGEEAKQVCPQIQLVQVPVARGKADLNTYRNAGSEVVSILARKVRCERASIDEVYLDLTDAAEKMLAEAPPENLQLVDEETLKSHVLGLNDEKGIDAKENVREWLCKKDADRRDKLLACGSLIVAELRMQVLKETEFTCSAGIAHNKILAKLASAMNKPAQQTVVPFSSVKGLLDSLPIKKMKQLGGKLGSSLQSDLGVSTVGDLLQFSEEKLQERYGSNTGTWLWNIARGISGEEVQGRLLPKSHGSGKTFPGPRALKTIASVQHWLNELCEELSERIRSDLDQNKRIARTLTLHASAYKSGDTDSQKNFPSKSCHLRYGTAKMQEDAFNLFQAGLREFKPQGSQNSGWRITGLSVSASKIVEIPSGTSSIMKYFHGQNPSASLSKQSQDDDIQEPSVSESCSEMNLTEQEMKFPGEDSNTKCVMPCLDQQEHKQDLQKDQVMISLHNLVIFNLHVFQISFCSALQNPSCLLPSKGQDDFQEASLRNSGTECCSGIRNQSQQQRVFPPQQFAVSSSNRTDAKRKTSKDKGTHSILRFFKKTDPPSSLSLIKEEHGDNLQDVEALSPTASARENARHVEEGRESIAACSYKVDEIDPSVIEELPPEIQEEFRAWLRPRKRPDIVRRGSSIANYFAPTKRT
ncbi:DNA polymerase eta isoform X1 [Morus notabilis]|uniref:DNA polymerase eta isoform X1 n=1 Tax=Morus notabilis TaxID=981085 RepID=UPI000CED63D9|nr:DNA polymerase eta isoform X1 [Morus notabilis]